MASFMNDEEARDMELQRQIHEVYEVLLHATGEGRSTSKADYLERLGVH